MALNSQLVSGGQTGRAAAHDGNLLAGGGSQLGLEGSVGLHVVVSGKGLQVSNGQGLLHQSPAALVLTGMGADTTDGSGQGNLLLDDLHGFGVVAQSDLLHIALHVGMGGAVQAAGTLAVAVVVTHQQFQGDLPGLDNTLGFGVDLPAVSSHGGAGTHQLGQAFAFHNADTAGTVVLDLCQVAQGGDKNAVGFGNFQNGLALLADAFDAIDGNFDFTHVWVLLIPRPLRPYGRSGCTGRSGCRRWDQC